MSYFPFPYECRQVVPTRKNECAYGKVLEVLFLWIIYAMIYNRLFERSELSVVYHVKHKLSRELGLLIP